jgi:hypothetical protein
MYIYSIRDFIQEVKLINIVILFSKHSIQTITIGLILQNFCKKKSFPDSFFLFYFVFRLAVGVSQHGNLEEKLKMAFDIYGK